MAQSKGEVLNYIGAKIDIYFPENNVCCDLCPILETYARKQCRRTGEYIYDSRTTGYYCPLQFITDEKGEIK